MLESRSLIVIPARLDSTRLPRKLLLDRTGKPLIQHTYEAARQASLPEDVIVAVDGPELESAVREFGGRVQRTRPDAASGTDRVAEVARDFPEFDIIVNVQGDEPEVAGAAIDLAVNLLRQRPDAMMATLATPITSQAQFEDPACVKVVCDRQDRALYFSRSPIPFPRQLPPDAWSSHSQGAPFWQHVGLYAYRREFLLQLSQLPQAPAEKMESLEQLRVLHHGYALIVGRIDRHSPGIDTPADYEAFVTRVMSC